MMKRILNLSTLALLFFAAIFMTSCESEPGTGGSGGTGGTGGTDVQPTVSISSATDLTLDPSQEFTIDFSVIKGSSTIKAVSIYEGATKLATDRFKWNGVDAAANPLLVTGTDKEGLSWNATITAQATPSSTVQYKVEALDDNNLLNSAIVEVTTVGTPPTVTTASPTTIEGLDQGSKNGFRLSAMPGSGKLVSIEVQENGEKVDPTRIEWDGITMMSSENPFALSGTEQDGFEDVRLYVTLPMEEGTFVYSMIVTDEYGLSSKIDFTVTTAPSGTPVDVREDEVLNRDGSAPGGLDLDTGDNVPSNSSLAEIVDNGIDIDLPSASNWRQRISPENGATMKYVVAAANGIPEGYSFGSIATKEEIAGLYTNNTGTTITDAASTQAVQVGDEFIVSKDGRYWLLYVKEVVVTGNDNNDKYIFDVKF